MSGQNWQDCKLAIALCNNQKMVPSEFFWNFISIVKPINHVVLRGQSRIKAASLNRLVEEAWRWKADKIMFMDIDQRFSYSAIPQLLNRNLPIVSGLTYTVNYPYSPAAGWLKHSEDEKYAGKYECVNQDGEMWKENFSIFPDNEKHLVEVEWTGISCLLVDMSVFNKIYFPCFKDIWDDEVGDRIAGHDVIFCEAVRKSGYKIFVDTLVQCEHLTEISISDLYIKSFYKSNFHEKEYEILKQSTQERAYWEEQYFNERVRRIKRTYNKEWEIISSYIPEGATVADMGCGMGHLMELFKNKGAIPYGYDFSSTAISTLAERGLSGEVVDFRSFSPNGKTYDFVVGSHVLEHIEDDISFLNKCSSLLKDKSGKVIMSVPYNDNHPISLMEHSHNYNEVSLADTMKEVFNHVEIITVSKELFGKEVKPGLIAVGSHGI